MAPALKRGVADVEGVLKAVQILLGELQSGLGQYDVNKLLCDVEN